MTPPLDVPVINALKNNPLWTVSEIGTKVPLNAQNLIRGIIAPRRADQGQTHPGGAYDESCLATFDQIYQSTGILSNYAYKFNPTRDQLMVLDIESKCPAEIAAALLKMENILYSEVSSSGAGYHLLLPMPDNFYDFPSVHQHTALKEEHGYYEILLNHFMTFTGNPIPAHLLEQQTHIPTPSGEELFGFLATHAREKVNTSIALSVDKPLIPFKYRIKKLVDTLVERKPWTDTLETYHNDNSRYEYNALRYIYKKIEWSIDALVARGVIKDTFTHDGEFYTVHYEPEHLAWLTYELATEVYGFITPREKHQELRAGVPLLLAAASSVVAHQIEDFKKHNPEGEYPWDNP